MDEVVSDAPSGSEAGARRRLAYLGLASALVYLLCFTLIYWLPTYHLNVQDEIFQFAAREPWRGVLFYAALGVLFVLYLAAVRLVARVGWKQIGAREVGLWALLFCLLLIPVQPITSSDVYGYTFQGRIWAVLGENPFAHFYNEFSDDPFYFCVTFHNLPATTGYGPLWVAIEAALGWLARDRLLLNLLLLKGLAAVLHLGSAFLVFGTSKRLVARHSVAQHGVTNMLFYAWNPLLLHELVGNAHNDAAVVFLALLGFYLLCRAAPGWREMADPAGQTADLPASGGSVKGVLAAIPCLTAAALVKPVVVLWLPLVALWILAQQRDWLARIRQAVAIAVLVLLTAAVAYAPVWAGADTFRGLLSQSDIHGNSVPNLLIQALWSVWPEASEPIVQGVKLVTVVAFAPFYLVRLWASRRNPQRASFDVMLFYLLFVGFQFMPWYVAWLVAPAALLADPFRRRLAVALSVMAPFLYFPFGWQWAQDHLSDAGIAGLAALPLLGLCVWLGLRAWQGSRRR